MFNLNGSKVSFAQMTELHHKLCRLHRACRWTGLQVRPKLRTSD
jgi:hypothetical protein